LPNSLVIPVMHVIIFDTNIFFFFTENGIYLTDTESLKKYGPGGHTITARHTIDAILGLNNQISDSGGK
jgi:hypothetical protein